MLLRMALDLVDVMVLSGLLKTSLVEARMKMETGGLLRQALRIGLYFSIQLINVSLELKIVHIRVVIACNKISSKAVIIMVVFTFTVLTMASLACIKANAEYMVRETLLTLNQFL